MDDPLYSWLPDMPTFGLTKFERTMLTATGGVALDYVTHNAAIKYVGMPARHFAAYTIGIVGSAYLSGMALSYFIDDDEGVENYRYAVNSIVTGTDGGIRGRVHDSIFDVAMYVAPIADGIVSDVQYTGAAALMYLKDGARRIVDFRSNY